MIFLQMIRILTTVSRYMDKLSDSVRHIVMVYSGMTGRRFYEISILLLPPTPVKVKYQKIINDLSDNLSTSSSRYLDKLSDSKVVVFTAMKKSYRISVRLPRCT